MQFLLSAALQHFTPGVTHQPSHHSAVKCQQSQNPQPGPLSAAPGLMSTSLLLNEFPASFFFFLLISILCVCYSKSCLLETEPRKYRQTLFKIGSSNSSILSFEVFFFFFFFKHAFEELLGINKLKFQLQHSDAAGGLKSVFYSYVCSFRSLLSPVCSI